MFNFFKKEEKIQHAVSDKEMIRRHQEQNRLEHRYRMEHDPQYKENIEKSRAFFEANNEAREKAGLLHKPGSYTFTCPNCGSLCKGEWFRNGVKEQFYGGVDCYTCDIHLMV